MRPKTKRILRRALRRYKPYSSPAHDHAGRRSPPPPSSSPPPPPPPPSSAPAPAATTDVPVKGKRMREVGKEKGVIVRETEEIRVSNDNRQLPDEMPRLSRESDHVDNKGLRGSANEYSSKSNPTSIALGSESQEASGEIEKISSQQTIASTASNPISPTTTTTAMSKPPDICVSFPDSQGSSETGSGEVKGSPNLGDENEDDDNGNEDEGDEDEEGPSQSDDDEDDDESTPRASKEIPSGRSSSVTFDTYLTEALLNSNKERPTSVTKKRSPPSPPPPSAYSRGVSFDTFDNRDATDYSLTLNYKHKDYKHSRRSRTFLCGTDANDYSDVALEWLIDELVDDGDEVVCLRVVEKDSKIASEQSIDSKRYHEEGRKFFESVVRKMADTKSISLVMELAVGKVQGLIQRMIQIYEPASLIVGTRGRSLGVQGLLPGSISKYCLQQSPVPCIVVRPSNKREKKKQKRRADPTREHYGDVLRISDAVSGKIFDNGGKLEEEAAAVAQAIGLPSSVTDLPMRSSRTSLAMNASAGLLKSTDDARVMESPSGSNDDLGDGAKPAGKEVAMASGTLSPSPRATTISFQDDEKKESNPSVVKSPSAPTISLSEPREEDVKINTDSSTPTPENSGSAQSSPSSNGSSPAISSTSSSSAQAGTDSSDKTLTAEEGTATTTTATTNASAGDTTATVNASLANESAIQSSSSSSSSTSSATSSSSAAAAVTAASNDATNQTASTSAKTSAS